MNVKELRIGNIVDTIDRIGEVHLPSKVPMTVYEISSFEILAHQAEENPASLRSIPVIGIEDVCGLPLNEEWLIKFGFQNYHSWEYGWDAGGLQIIETSGYWYPAVFSHPEMSHEDDQCVSLNRVQYVHQLQNLYFAITGKELELNNNEP